MVKNICFGIYLHKFPWHIFNFFYYSTTFYITTWTKWFKYLTVTRDCRSDKKFLFNCCCIFVSDNRLLVIILISLFLISYKHTFIYINIVHARLIIDLWCLDRNNSAWWCQKNELKPCKCATQFFRCDQFKKKKKTFSLYLLKSWLWIYFNWFLNSENLKSKFIKINSKNSDLHGF